MTTTKKLYAGKHELENGNFYYGAGYAVVNENGKVIEVFSNKKAAKLESKQFNLK